MTNIFFPGTKSKLTAADRVFAVMTDLATWSVQEDQVHPTSIEHAVALIKDHMAGIQIRCYSNGMLLRR